MTATVYYNEINPDAADRLEDLIHAGHIADGVVDRRSIEDVRPGDLADFTQCHFFAGFGIWSLALRRAGWPDDRPVWTGSCPCQPFSSAGEGTGFDDERHLWPHFHWLIQERRPPVVYGEQVASKDAEPWLDLVQADLEALGYALGCVPFPSAGIGAPHIRDRLFWVADAERHQQRPGRGAGREAAPRHEPRAESGGCGEAGRLDHPHDSGDRPQESSTGHRQPEADRSSDQPGGPSFPPGEPGDTDSLSEGAQRGLHRRPDASTARVPADRPAGATNGLWAAADWLLCRDGRWRPVEPGTFPLAHGLPRGMGSLQPELRRLAELAGLDGKSLARAKAFRVGGLRGYGNAINAEAARIFIESTMRAAA